MTEEKKVVIDDVEYKESELSDESKVCINHISSLDQKIASAQFNLAQLQVGREGFMKMLADSLNPPEEAVN
tara:strand:+ start:291 stop:503 length:213 start_codon:yes stop_codon:yes gene_type:complete